MHIPNYFCLENDIAYLSNYEATFDYFPVDFRDGLTLYDKVENLEDDYDLIHSNNYNRLYRRKKARPDENLPGTK